MTRLRGALFLALSACALLSPAPGAAELSAVEAKQNYERGLESKLERLLDEMLGPRRARVFIDATLDQSYTEESQRKAPEDGEGGGDVLPGYPPPRTVKRVSPAKNPVKRLGVSVVVDPSVAKEQLQTIADTLTEVLGLDPERGDALRVSKAPLRRTLAKAAQEETVSTGILLLAGACVIGLAGFLAALPLLRRALRPGRRRLRREDSPVSHAVEILPDGAGEPGFLSAPRPLDLHFILPEHLKAVARFLSGQPAQSARWILASLDEENAAALFRMLSEELREKAASELLHEAAPSEADCRRLAQALREFIGKEAAGPGLLEHLLARASEETRHQILDHIRAESPVMAGRIHSGLLTFEDLARADAPSLVSLAGESTSGELALALQDASPSLQKAFLAALPGVFKDNVEKRLKFLAPNSSGDVDRARAAVLARWRELESSGKVKPL